MERMHTNVAARIRADNARLVERAGSGDQQAFAALVSERLEPTFRTALAILGDEADARDATQEIFIRVWRNLPGLRNADLFQAWFGRIVVNTCRSSIRGRRRRIVREISVGSLSEDDERLTPAVGGYDDRTADLDMLEGALDRLSPAERTLLALHHHEGLSLDEIGRRYDLPARTIKSRLFTARRSLERAIEVEGR